MALLEANNFAQLELTPDVEKVVEAIFEHMDQLLDPISLEEGLDVAITSFVAAVREEGFTMLEALSDLTETEIESALNTLEQRVSVHT